MKLLNMVMVRNYEVTLIQTLNHSVKNSEILCSHSFVNSLWLNNVRKGGGLLLSTTSCLL
jgi:hypothetical protein